MEQNPSPNQDIVHISDLDSFVQALVHWHTNKVAQLNHMKSIPEGTEVRVDEGPPITLEGATLTGFQLGLSLALGELGTLPFTIELDQDDATVLAAAAQEANKPLVN